MFQQFKFILLCAATLFTCAEAQRDATLEEEAVGKEVTEAVVRKLTLSKIFPEDHSFFIRLAYTETRFGENNDTFRTDYHGGIWAVDESYFNRTQTPFLAPKYASIERKFNIEWLKVEWRDLRKPMYSGIAVALYFSFELGVAIPQKIEDQAHHWVTYWRPDRNVSDFIKDAEKLQEETTCRGKFDLCIVLDSSGSIGLGDYRVATKFVGDLIESFSRDFTRVGMLIYSTGTEVIFRVNNTNTTAELADMAREAPYQSGWTETHLGILEAITLLKEVNDTVGIPKIITVFTDGGSTGGQSALEHAIESMKNNTIKPMSIGIGSGINEPELRLIALNDSRSVFIRQDFSALQSFLQQLTSVTCEIPQAPVLNETYDDSLIENEKRIYKIEPPKEGITITIDVSEGGAKGFWSHSIPVPTEVLNDGIIEGPTYIPAPPGIVGRKKRQSEGEEEEEEPLTNIYITVQGVEPTNNYTLVMTDGDQEPTTTTPTTTTTTTTPTTTTTTTTVPTTTTATTTTITPPTDNGAPLVSLASILVAVVSIFHIVF